MKLQFNLLPDVKQEYLKTRRTKRTVITAALVASSIAFFILLFALITVYVINKKQLSDADGSIKNYSNQLKSIPNLDKVLTIQNQLKSIQTLHESKHKMSRLYTYLPQITPAHVCIGQLTVDTALTTITIQGSSDSQRSINTFVDTLKFTKYKLDNQSSGKNAFTNVIESQFGISTSATSGNNNSKCQGAAAPAAYQLTLQFDPVLFANSSSVELSVPQGLVTTRSVIDDPSNIFNGSTLTPSKTDQSAGGQ
jgi:Tfp pilus assembly protein PilN